MEGIMFLTTNRIQSFDPAILSRIHLPLRYGPLNQEARKEVWRCFIEQATTKAGPAAYTERVIAKLAEKTLNGREVRRPRPFLNEQN
jgi:AAA+ superfamily predicted ATPase